MKIALTLIVVEALGTVPKDLEKKPMEKGIKEKVETIQTTALFKSGSVLKNGIET